MPTPTSHLASMLESLCHTLAECNRVLVRAKPGSHEARRARAIVAALEPEAIACLDEELCNVPAVRVTVYESISMPLIRHLRTMVDGNIYIGKESWQSITLSASPAQAEEMMDLGLSPEGAIQAMLRTFHSRAGWLDLMHRRCVKAAALDKDEVLTLINSQDDKNLQDILHLIRCQITTFPRDYARITQAFLDDNATYHAAALILAGVAPEDIDPNENHAPVTQLFLERIKTRHGMLAFLSDCPSLEQLIKVGTFSQYQDRLYATLREARGREKAVA